MKALTCKAPINIAVIKYWGKRDENLVLPINSSLSTTLDCTQMRAKTSVAISKSFDRDRMWLNGVEESLSAPRYQNVLKEIRRRSRKRKAAGNENNCCSSWHIHICSENNFPTAAGLASSAAGFACLAYGLTKLFEIESDLPVIARQGSGSACRSVYGGFVEWQMGVETDGSDSLAVQLAPYTHWPQLRILIVVVSSHQKHTSSTNGMKRCTNTSELLKHRAQRNVPERLKQMKRAILEHDFASFAELTMRESNEMHACCLDAYPPISYLTDTSRHVQALVHHINDQHTQPIVAYTFDAGPNACLYMLEENVAEVSAYIAHCYQARSDSAADFFTGLPCIPKDLTEKEAAKVPPVPLTGTLVKYVIHTQVGEGPQVLDDSDSLLDNSGLPKTACTS